ncbi:MAG: WecB/TagA/CpsF family glycosyltransferase [Pseudomonadota bacterium]
MTGRRFRKNLNGTDLFLPLCRAAADRGLSIYILGSRPGEAAAAAEKAAALAPGLRIAGTADGYFGAEEEDYVIERSNRSGADILLVALGVPRRNVWIAKHRTGLAPRLAMGVGAQFDFWLGRVSRAPLPWRRAGREWAWRLMLELRRLLLRYVLGNPVFVVRAAKQAAQWHLARFDAVTAAKRGIDVAVAGAALLVPAFFFLLISAAIKAESPGPVLFLQTRIDRNEKPFRICKFRSMHRDAAKRRVELEAKSDRRGICFKPKEHPRATRVGRLPRRGSLYELPQIFNVIRGEMAIVGPRPALPEEVDSYSARAHRRLTVRPGITGLSQVSGRADISFEKMVDMTSPMPRHARPCWI